MLHLESQQVRGNTKVVDIKSSTLTFWDLCIKVK